MNTETKEPPLSSLYGHLTLKRIRGLLLGHSSSPRLTAKSFAIGVALAFSPFVGLHFVVAFILIKVLRLNTLVTMVGIFVHNPWTMLPIHFSALVLGDFLLSGSLSSIQVFQQFPWQDFHFLQLFDGDFWRQSGQPLLALIAPFVLGSTLLSLICSTLSYVLTLRFLHRNRNGGEMLDAR